MFFFVFFLLQFLAGLILSQIMIVVKINKTSSFTHESKKYKESDTYTVGH